MLTQSLSQSKKEIKDLSTITKKFYSTEEKRQEYLESNKDIIDEVTLQIQDYIHLLNTKKIAFYIFKISGETIHAGLVSCCGATESITDEISKDVEKYLIENTRFQYIKWEIIA